MAERFGFGAIEDAIVTLLTDNSTALNNGLDREVKAIITKKPDNIVIGLPKYPAICVWFDNADMEFRGASKRKNVEAHYQLHYWTHDKYSIDKSKDEADLLGGNIVYIIDGNTGIASLSSTRGYIIATRISYDYNTNESGFITHGSVDLTVVRVLN